MANVPILGGGFGGVVAAERLAKKLGARASDHSGFARFQVCVLPGPGASGVRPCRAG